MLSIAQIKTDKSETSNPTVHIAEPKHKRKKLRRLAMEKSTSKRSTFDRTSRLILCTSLICIVFAVLLGLHMTQLDDNTNLFKKFLRSYRKHYSQIVHGQDDYCDRQLDSQALFKYIKQQHIILHQEVALQQLEVAMRNNSGLNAIAVVGKSGVGKSRWAHALLQHFPWRNNVHAYAWNTYVEDESQKLHVLRVFANKLSDCGQNLIVIDNLTPCDYEVVNIFNNMVIQEIERSDSAKLHIIVIYIFSLNSMEPIQKAVYRQQYKILQQLPDTKTINFRSFGATELRDCICHEASLENISLNGETVQEIMATINVHQSGCKNVHAKVLTFGSPLSSTKQTKI